MDKITWGSLTTPPPTLKKNKPSVSESKLVYVMFFPLDLAFEPPHYHTALKGFCKNNFLGTSCCSLSSFISQWCWLRAACSSATGSQAEQQRLGETLVSARSLKLVALFYISDSDWPLTFFFFFYSGAALLHENLVDCKVMCFQETSLTCPWTWSPQGARLNPVAFCWNDCTATRAGRHWHFLKYQK